MTVLRLIKPLRLSELNSSHRTSKIAKKHQHEMDERCAVAKKHGKLKAFLRGLTNLKMQQLVGKSVPSDLLGLCIWHCL